MAVAQAPVPLRPHHLLCSLTYRGEGYSAAFITGYDRMIETLAAGAPIRIVEGPDVICAPRLGEPDCHCHEARIAWRDRQAAADLAPCLGQALPPGTELPGIVDYLPALRAAFAEGTLRKACSGCAWHDLCDQVALAGFAGTRLLPPVPSIP
ncbi:MAG: DUF1284 domain-containing protein [Beijerinckiaceae bacterium]|nr:DUF1284 domain-containing protein [Beijerinckiaceae bacterium]MCZ8299046.1 DUF1284 domain-containing protein [Beijerinckiaceae bacterium]